MRRLHPTRSNARGFTLIEALIALLVLSFGMLAIAGFQVTLTRSSDIAKQRSEATRLAQQKMEELRTYGQVAADPASPPAHKFNYTENVVSYTVATPERPVVGPDIITSNATFTRTWSVTQNAADTEKQINVVVGWDDRAAMAPVPTTAVSRIGNTGTVAAPGHSLVAGDWVRLAGTSDPGFNGTFSVVAATSTALTFSMPSPPAATSATGGTAQKVNAVQLLSVISKFDPQDIGTLATGPGGNNVRRPKNRNINIPYPAVTLSDRSRSAFIPPPGNVAFVFDNTTGNIVASCTGLTPTSQAPTPVTITTLTGDGTTVTVNASSHSFVANNRVTISGTNNAAFHGTFTVTGVSPGVSFTYAATPLGSASGGTATQVVTRLTEGLDIATAAGVSCISIDAYLLSGYVRFDVGNTPSPAVPNNNNTFPLDAGTPLLIDVSNRPTPSSGGDPSMVCYAQRQKVVTTSPTPRAITTIARSGSTVTVNSPTHTFVAGDTVAINAVSPPAFIGAFVVDSVAAGSFTYTLPPPLPTATTASGGTATLVQRLTVPETTTVSGYSAVSRFVSYACVVTPVDHDSSVATPRRWWGKVTLNPNSALAVGTVWQIGTASGQYKVCRDSADYNASGAISNSEHPLWYRGVTGALDSQNFLVIDRSENCPTDRPQDLLGNPVNFADKTTARHQPASYAELSFQCPAGGCGTKNFLELTVTTSDLLMD